jgi:hypothetical protein
MRVSPAIRVRNSRIHFKFGDTKAGFYFNDADLDVSPYTDGSVELRFGGAPSRTDRSTQDFGRFFLRGTAAPGSQRLDLQVDLERSSLQETLRWINPGGFGVHGTVALTAQLSGAPSHLDVSGQMQVADVHRWDLVLRGGASQILQAVVGLHYSRSDESEADNVGLRCMMRAGFNPEARNEICSGDRDGSSRCA